MGRALRCTCISFDCATLFGERLLGAPVVGRYAGVSVLMKRPTAGTTVTSELDGTTPYDRVVGFCSARGRGLGQQMIDDEVYGIYHKYNTEGRY
jgi:hypothetical protein